LLFPPLVKGGRGDFYGEHSAYSYQRNPKESIAGRPIRLDSPLKVRENVS